jgi:hypothetical protein
VLVIHVMLMGVDFEVVEPPELTDRVREARDRLSRALASEADRGAGTDDGDSVREW